MFSFFTKRWVFVHHLCYHFNSRIGLDWACSVADILRNLNISSQWCAVVAAFTDHCIQQLPQQLKRTNLFTLLVLVGFPEVWTKMSHVHALTHIILTCMKLWHTICSQNSSEPLWHFERDACLFIRCCVWGLRLSSSIMPTNNTTWFCSNTSLRRTELLWWTSRLVRGEQVREDLSTGSSHCSHSFLKCSQL